MFTHRSFHLLIVLALLVITACSPQVTLTPIAAQSEPISLRLAISDGNDSAPSGHYVLEFVSQVKTLSNGNITIEPVWAAGDTTEVGFERGVIQLVRDGKFDLGIAASRAFDNNKDHITSFQALQAPFLVDNDALVVAVATSDVATQMLDNLASAGLAGLTLWPEDLRHPFSLAPGKPLLSPQDFVGLNIRTTPSGVSNMMVEALGGKPMFEESGYDGAESGLRQGASLTGTPTATGNVTFFAKYQVLFVNGTAYKKLNDEQRTVLQQAAVATQKKALTEHPSDAEAGTAWCADGGSIALASDEQVVAFQKAAQPVLDKLQNDSFNAESITAIRELKAKTKSSAGAQACTPAVAVPTQASTENQTWSQGLPPNGKWTVELSDDDVVKMGVLKSSAKDWSGQQTYEFQDGEGIFRKRVNNAEVEICPFTYKAVENFVRLSFRDTGLGHYDCGNDHDDVQWRLDKDGLHFHLVDTTALKVEITAIYEAKSWQKVESWSQGLPPNGVWQAKLTTDDFVRMGDLQSVAQDWAGMYTITFKDGKLLNVWQGEQGQTGHCQANYEVVGDVVRLTFYTDANDCPNEMDDIQWRLDADGLHLHLVAIKNSQFIENKAMYEAKPWQKVETP